MSTPKKPQKKKKNFVENEEFYRQSQIISRKLF